MSSFASPPRLVRALLVTVALVARPAAAHDLSRVATSSTATTTAPGLPPGTHEHEPGTEERPHLAVTSTATQYSITVRARRPVTAASSFTVRDQDFLLRPHQRPADILGVTPGLFVVQHSGGGKANQYFLRGFDADHGTDVAFSLDGVPVNMVSHGHGQGFADWNFLIPETVERVEITKGPYFPENGDFDTGGAINLVTRTNEAKSSAQVGAGSFDTYRALITASPVVDGWKPYLAAEYYRTNGPFLHGEELERASLFAKVTHDFDSGARFSLALTSYGSGWNASGQVPERAVRAGTFDRFDAVDPTEGGSSARHSLYATYRATTEDTDFSLLAYVVQYRFQLYSNFTFVSEDPVHGDEIEQDDVRTVAGLGAKYKLSKKVDDLVFDTTFGMQLRSDVIENGLHHVEARKRIGDLVDDDVREGTISMYLREDLTLTSWLRAMFGARGDYFGFDVSDHLEDLSPAGAKTSGVRQAGLLSPKASLILSPLENLDLYLNFGWGFHSNDARGVVRGTDAVTPLTRAKGYEAGFRTKLFRRLDLAGAAFLLDLDSEIVWVGDAGTTEASGATRRKGVEGELRLRIFDWLFADADATLTDGAFRQDAGNGTAIALAPRFLLSAGVSARHPTGVYGRLGLLHIADRPATEDELLKAPGFTRLDLSLGYRNELFEVALSVQNLTNTDWREAQFANVSRLPGETSPASCPAGTRAALAGGTFKGCEDVHFTPGAPINLFASATLFL